MTPGRSTRTGRSRLAVWLCGLGLAALASASGAEPVAEVAQTAVVELRHRPAEEVLPALGPHLPGRGVEISASGSRLFLRGPTRALGPLIDLIEAIDVPPRQLWITLALEDAPSDRPPARDTLTTRRTAPPPEGPPAESGGSPTFSTNWRTGGEIGQRLRVQEGEWAALGFAERSGARGFPVWVRVAPGIEVFAGDLGTPGADRAGGLRVRPRLVGEGVRLDVAFFAEAGGPVTGGSQVNTLTTTLTGRLGEWIPLNGPSGAPPLGLGEAVIARTRSTGPPRVLLRVDPSD